MLRLVPKEPDPAFRLDTRTASVVWTLTGLHLRASEDFAALSDLFLKNGWPRNFNALADAELALSDAQPRALGESDQPRT